MATDLRVELRHLMLTIQGLGSMLRDTVQEREEFTPAGELLPWLGSELERVATEAYRLADEARSTEPPGPSAEIWCQTPFCCLKPGHEEPCQ
jgi:hypothetical protein